MSRVEDIRHILNQVMGLNGKPINEGFALEVDGENYSPDADDDLYYDWQSADGIPEDMIAFAEKNFREDEWMVFDNQTGEIQGDNEGEGAILDPSRASDDWNAEKQKADDATRAAADHAARFGNMDEDAVLDMLAKQAAEKNLDFAAAVNFLSTETDDTSLLIRKYDIIDALEEVGIVEPILDAKTEHRLIQEITMQMGLWGTGMEEDPSDGLTRIFNQFNLGDREGSFATGKGWDWWQQGGEEKVVKSYGGAPGEEFYDVLAGAYDDFKGDNPEHEGLPDQNPWKSQVNDSEDLNRILHLSGQEKLSEEVGFAVDNMMDRADVAQAKALDIIAQLEESRKSNKK